MKLLVLLLLVSCAQTQVSVKNSEVKPFKEFSKITKVSDNFKSIVIDSVVDKREDQSAIGSALTGVKYEKTPVMLETSTDVYVKEYITQAFNRRGLFVTEIDGIKMSVHINELWVEELIEKYQPEKAKCKANLSVFIDEGKKSWKGNYWIEIVSPGDLADGTEKIAPTLGSCLNEIVEKMVNDKGFLANFR